MRIKLMSYIGLLRPQQWLKNLLLLFPPFFGGKLFHSGAAGIAIPALISFSLIASCGYILNDIKDRGLDRHHHTKKKRALVSGDIPLAFAFTLAGMLYLGAMLVGANISSRFEGFLIIYLFLTLSYTFYFKNIVVLDIFVVAACFIVRIFAGGAAFQVAVSNWLFLTVFIVSLFLAAGKRMGEMNALGSEAHKQRMILASYSESFLEGALWICAAAAIVMYALYSIENKRSLVYTVPIVCYGFFRYLFVLKNSGNGDPTDILIKDSHMIATGILWIFMVAFIVYD